MKSVVLRILVSFILCSLVATLLLSGVAITKSKGVLQAEVRKELLYAGQKYANLFSTEFKTQENVVDMLCTVVSNGFDVESYEGNRTAFLSLENRLNQLIYDTMQDIPETMSLYFTFTPETSGGNDEIWYLRDREGNVVYTKADNTVTDWLVDGNEDSEYYFQAIRKGKNWSSVEYDMYIDRYSVTYSRCCWDKNGRLIGVMGTDIFIDDIFETVKHIQVEEGGYAFLMDGKHNYLIGSADEKTFQNLKEQGVIDLPKSSEKQYSYATIDEDRFLTTYAETSNGWVLTMTKSEKNLLQSVTQMKRLLYTIVILIVVGVLAYAFYFFKKSLAPIVKEYEQKDLIMLHQSRQAKLGEMVGNIAHQWKQPLNVMNITLSNLLDDYHHEKISEENLKEHVDKMRICIKNMSSTVDDFADFLKPARKKEVFDAGEAVKMAIGLMQEGLKLNRIKVTVELEENLLVTGFKNEFCQGIFNVLSNGKDAILEAQPQKRWIQVYGYTQMMWGQKEIVVLEMINTGNPISQDLLSHVFELYVSTKEENGGTGIGLYLTREIIELHMNGSIELYNVEGGVCCRVTIPKEVEHE